MSWEAQVLFDFYKLKNSTSVANAIAYYQFTEGSGYSVPDQIGGVGTAYFGKIY